MRFTVVVIWPGCFTDQCKRLAKGRCRGTETEQVQIGGMCRECSANRERDAMLWIMVKVDVTLSTGATNLPDQVVVARCLTSSTPKWTVADTMLR